jgi:hypothetical protein
MVDYVTGVNLTPLKRLACSGPSCKYSTIGSVADARRLARSADQTWLEASIKSMPGYIKTVAEHDRSIVF